jgi:hypothetical protein
MQISSNATIDLGTRTSQLTEHASQRMYGRGLSERAIEAVVEYGRGTYAKGAYILAIGRKEVERHKEKGIDLSEYEGLQVICSAKDSAVITVYRNHDFRGIRPKRRHPRKHGRSVIRYPNIVELHM